MIIYLAHPVGSDVDANAARAVRWLHWLMQREPEHTIVAPWLPYCAIWKLLGDAKSSDRGHPFRERVMRDNIITVRRLDGVVLVGGHVSPGMKREAEESIVSGNSNGGTVWDLTHLGEEPPTDFHPDIRPLSVVRAIRSQDDLPWVSEWRKA